jgi:plasmid stability protein
MASITVRNIEDSLKARLRARAASNGRSMEEARHILRQALDEGRPSNLADLATEIFGSGHGFELEPHPRVPPPRVPDFEEP